MHFIFQKQFNDIYLLLLIAVNKMGDGKKPRRT